MSRRSEPTPYRGPKIPFHGFRVVFALVNGLLWFGLAYGILSGITTGVVAAGRFTENALRVTAGAVGLLVGLFGLPGALGGFLDQARSGRLQLPPEAGWGRRGQLDNVWAFGLVAGVVNLLVAQGLAAAWLPGRPLPARGEACLQLALLAAGLAFVQSLFLSRRGALFDLLPPASPPRAADRDYLIRRFALPQGLGNGLITALVAWGTFAPAAGSERIAPVAAALDSGITALVIGGFMLLGGGGLARVDRRFGRVAPHEGAPPSKLRRLALVLAAAAAVAAVAFALAALAGGLSLPVRIVFQALVGGAVAAYFATLAARAAGSGVA